MPLPLRFLFDYLSPYAYVAWTQLPALAQRHGRAVEPVPVLLAGLLGAWGHKGPAEIPPKRLWTFKNVYRTAHRLGVPLVPPPTHPFNPLLALRVSGLPMAEEARTRLITGLYEATWADGRGVTDPAVVAAVADAAGLDGRALVAQAGSSEAKERLKRTTEEAIAAGAFGVPTLLVGDELFWGYDAFPELEAWLRGEDPVTPEALARWAGIGTSARRG